MSKSYGKKKVLDNISLKVESGTRIGIIAPEGAGKTTFLKIMAGCIKPDSGRVYYNGVDVTNKPLQTRNIGLVHQDYINYTNMNVHENIASPLRASGNYSEEEIREGVKETAKLLGIENLLDRDIDELSGGERQRTAIARAMSKKKDILFMDEPFTNLDYKLREELRASLKKIVREKGTTVVYATPRPRDAFAICSHLAILHEGKIIQDGRIQEIYSKPKNARVATYISDPPINILDGEVTKKGRTTYLQINEDLRVDFNYLGEPPVKDHYKLGILPSDLGTIKGQENMISFKARVKRFEISGSETTIYLESRDMEIRMLKLEPGRYKTGREMNLYFDPERAFLFGEGDKLINAPKRLFT